VFSAIKTDPQFNAHLSRNEDKKHTNESSCRYTVQEPDVHTLKLPENPMQT
jgi:hypothetical protein